MCIVANCSWSCVYCVIVLCVLCYCLVCIVLLSCVYCCYYLVCIVVTLCVLLYYVCIAVLYTSVVGLLARRQYPEGPETGHLDTGFSWFPCVCL